MCTRYQYTGRCWCDGRTGQVRVIESVKQDCTQKPPRGRCPNFKPKTFENEKCYGCIQAAAVAAAAEAATEAEAARILWGMRNGRW
ncbi:hypothetical protein BOTNAR_0073g00120 [Botryotinia narcissicola]|uniref:Uncharacterized protein n=1 Tax=Botryotinia narcissicola TaxID=278944 RepID=A0A4Z1JAC3_9HELO|nr:hypothetical protein BOTNAR_0073g00120 [Botryotinia narcissicola]